MGPSKESVHSATAAVKPLFETDEDSPFCQPMSNKKLTFEIVPHNSLHVKDDSIFLEHVSFLCSLKTVDCFHSC
jgi:hypothetical protein